jgi:hypothetical protein
VYIVCSGKIGGACKAGNIRADKAELGFREVLLNAVNADYFMDDNRAELMKARALEGQIGAVEERRVKLLAILNTYPTEEVAAALGQARAELATLKAEKDTLDQAAVQRVNLSRTREALLAKIDLTGNTARMDANNLLRRLRIVVEIARQDPQVVYTVKQSGKQILLVRQVGEEPVAMAYSEDTAMRMYERGETGEPEMNFNFADYVKQREAEADTPA